jgi:hypothetical protein
MQSKEPAWQLDVQGIDAASTPTGHGRDQV